MTSQLRASPPTQASHELSVRYVKGIGPARAAVLQRLEIETVEDLLCLVPRRYEDRTNLQPIGELVEGQPATVRARILSRRFRPIPGGRPLVEATLGDDTGQLRCRWFNQPYLMKWLVLGEELIVHGKVERRGQLQIINPELERLDQDAAEAAIHMGRIVPVYPLTEGVSQRWMRKTLYGVVQRYAPQAPELLPEPFRSRLDLAPAAWAYSQIHFPDDAASLQKAQRRLAFEELLMMQLRLAMRRARLTARHKPQRYAREGELTRAFVERLPFALTTGQRRAMDEVAGDLAQPTPMLRLIQGDVGCGKTVVAAYAAALAVQSGYQVAFMAPTELLAQQHARVLTGYLQPLGVLVGLLTQSLPEPERPALLRAVAQGEVQVLLGTHALLQESVRFRNLALVIVDEQHKFGVAQRVALVGKGSMPDVLIMTATPIPRTLALSIYGDLASSTIADMPPGRAPVTTQWLDESRREAAYRIIREELQYGHQGYVVYPVVDEKNRLELKAATQMAGHLQRDVVPEFRVGLLHGRMKPGEQEAVMRDFLAGRVQLLVSTVIVEVGLDVANATVMLIEHPERFGLSQLHQLRGRIGRGTAPSTCLIISDAAEELARQRLSAFAQTSDGFKLAEHDLALRGPGELLGRRQHGWSRFRMAALPRDTALLEAARREAFDLVARDPELGGREWAGIKQRLKRAAVAPVVGPERA